MLPGSWRLQHDIRDANKRVNKLLNQARQIQNTLTSPSIDCGNGRYSLADLCGMGSADHNFFSACTDIKNYMTDSMKFSIEAIEGNLSNGQKMSIWNKYGISPRNYLFVQQSVSQVKTQAAKLMAKATDEAVQLQRDDKISKTNAIIQAAYAQTDSNGNMTEAAANEANLYLNQQKIDGRYEGRIYRCVLMILLFFWKHTFFLLPAFRGSAYARYFFALQKNNPFGTATIRAGIFLTRFIFFPL